MVKKTFTDMMAGIDEAMQQLERDLDLDDGSVEYGNTTLYFGGDAQYTGGAGGAAGSGKGARISGGSTNNVDNEILKVRGEIEVLKARLQEKKVEAREARAEQRAIRTAARLATRSQRPPPKPQMPPNISVSDWGETSITVGDSDQSYAYEFTHNEPNTDTRVKVQYNDEYNYTVHSNVLSIDTDYIVYRIQANMRSGRHKQSAVPAYHTSYVPTNSKSPIREQLTDSLEAQIRKRVGLSDPKPEPEHIHEEPMDYNIFYTRTLFGKQGEPMDIRSDAEVSVSGHNIFGRKYEVRIDGNAIHVPFLERYMLNCYRMDNIDIFIEMRTDIDKVILGKVFKGLIAMNIAEPHHIAINELL